MMPAAWRRGARVGRRMLDMARAVRRHPFPPRALLDIIYPRACAGCGGPVGLEGDYLCWDCQANLPYVRTPFCARCGDPVAGQVDAVFECWACARARPHFDRARSVARYDGIMRELLRAFKYSGAVWLRRDLARLLAACAESELDLTAVDAVAPVPLFPARRRARGYNQAELLSGTLAGWLGRPHFPGALRRARETPTQTHLTAADRATNVRDAFVSRGGDRLAGLRLLLVDDVMTTGATVNECARALKAAGAAAVQVCTVGRG